MARDEWAYREVAVVSCLVDGAVKICPVPGQAYSPALLVHCSKALSDPGQYPLGSYFRVSAKLTDRQGGQPFLYVYHGDPVQVMTEQQTDYFVSEFKRGRI